MAADHTTPPSIVLEVSPDGDLATVLAPWRSAWRDLAAEVDGSFFQLPEWFVPWWETVGGRPPTTIGLWTDPGGSLRAAVALSRTRTRLHPRLPVAVGTLVNTGSGFGSADHLGPLCLPHLHRGVAAWLGSRRGGSLLLSNLDPATRSAWPAGAVETEHSRCPRASIGPDTGLGRSSQFRRQLRARVRKANDAGLSFVYRPPGAVTTDDLDVLMSLHEARWDEKEGISSFGRSRLDLHRRALAFAGPDVGPVMVIARTAAAPVGVVYGFVWNGTFSFYQSGWDPAWASFSLGTVIHAVAVELMAAAGVRVYDFLRGAEDYKYRFGAVDVVDTTLLVPRGLGGRLLTLKASVKSRETKPDETPAPG